MKYPFHSLPNHKFEEQYPISEDLRSCSNCLVTTGLVLLMSACTVFLTLGLYLLYAHFILGG